MKDQGYYRHPTVHGSTVVFACEDDLWAVAASGGVARRLTASPGTVTFPRFSPDGKRLAYTSTGEGPAEVYVMDAGGGAGRRLTWLGALTRTVGWTRDGKSVLFQSNAARPFARDQHLHTVPAAGGPHQRLPLGMAHEIAFEPNGKGVVLGRNSGDPARWKRYRGGTAGTLWIDRKGDGRFAPFRVAEGNVANPMWIGGRIWFLSDHEGHGNLYSCTPAGRDLRRHTDHDDYYARYPTTDGARIVYHAGADLHLYDVEADRGTRIEVGLQSARPGRRRRFVDAAEHLETADLHPEGAGLVCVARGGAFTLGLWEGAPLRHGEPSAARTRLARFLADGERIVAVSDAGGEETLIVFRADGTGRAKTIEGDFGRILDLVPAPAPAASVVVAFTNHRQEVWVATLDNGEARAVEASRHERIAGVAWSPDGRWLAYGFASTRRSSSIHLLDRESGAIHEITRPEFVDFAPSFDQDGRHLYFLSLRAFDPVIDSQYFDLSFPRGVVPCLVPLAKETPSPFDAALRAPQRPRAKPPRPEEPNGDDDDEPTVRIDLENISDRVVAFPMPEGRYRQILGGHGRVFLTSMPVEGTLEDDWRAKGPPPAKTRLEVWDFERERAETLLSATTETALSLDGHTLLVRVGNRLRALPAAIEARDVARKDEPGRESGWVDLGRLRLEVVPELEWRQMMREAWRLQRDQFWTEDMSRIDWKNALERYLPLVDRVATRSEFSDLIWELQGELGTSHCYELGGDYAPGPAWHQGQLGADIEWDAAERAWVVRRIPRGDSWDRKARSPLQAPGVGVGAGDHLLAIGGQALAAGQSPFERLVHQAGQAVALTVRGKDGGARRQTAITTLANEMPLRYRDWVEANRARVRAETDGRVGYLHIPDMGPHGFSEFHRSFKNEVDLDGLIVDVRWNGGGNVSQLLLEKLIRRPISFDVARWQSLGTYPADAPLGPMVAVTNEHAGSDGDIFSHAWKLYQLGPLIGKRTWGGVIGIWPRHALVDGTITTQAEFSTFFVDVGWAVENYGTDPDIEVDIAPQDYAADRDPQLDRALREIKRLLREKKSVIPDLAKRPDLRAPKLRVVKKPR